MMIRFGDRCLPSVLIVDDDAAVRTLIEAVLSLDGHEVVTAVDGREACETLNTRPDVGLAVLDLVMPNKEGIETMRDIRQSHPQVHIIAISGAFGGQCLEIARYLGADDTMAKPLDLARLRASVLTLLKE